MSNVKKKTERVLPQHYQAILSPVITEKSNNNAERNQVTFRVLKDATKPLIKTAVEQLFDVKVKAVNTQVRKGKTKRFRGRMGQRSDEKIATVTLEKGSSIDVSTGL